MSKGVKSAIIGVANEVADTSIGQRVIYNLNLALVSCGLKTEKSLPEMLQYIDKFCNIQEKNFDVMSKGFGRIGGSMAENNDVKDLTNEMEEKFILERMNEINSLRSQPNY